MYYDAWINDNDVDPILSIVYEIIKQLDMDISLKEDIDKKKAIMAAIADIFDHFTGSKIGDFFEALKTQNYLSEVGTNHSMYDTICSFFSEILQERGNRLVILVDELDRCKPNFAVKVLERIKHYFGDQRVTFIFAVNICELQHTICHHYGTGFSADRYLNRFFDLTISLPEPDMAKYYKYIEFPDSTYVFDDVCRNVMKKLSMTLRETEKYIRIVKMAYYDAVHTKGRVLGSGFSDARTKEFGATYFVPIMLGLKLYDIENYEKFVSGNNPELLIDFIPEGLGRAYEQYMLANSETFSKEQNEKTYISYDRRIKEIYEALFFDEESQIGDLRFSAYTRKQIIDITNLFSSFTMLN